MKKTLMRAACAALLALPAAGQSPGHLTFGGQFFTLFTYQPTSSFGTVCRCAFYGGGVTFTARLVKRLASAPA